MDLCETCIHARDSEGQPICHGFRRLVQMAQEIKDMVDEDDMPVIRLAEPMLPVLECRAHESNARNAKVLTLVKN